MRRIKDQKKIITQKNSHNVLFVFIIAVCLILITYLLILLIKTLR